VGNKFIYKGDGKGGQLLPKSMAMPIAAATQIVSAVVMLFGLAIP
jgi:hypothetical protein